jgi:hypothetical protein
MLMPLNEILKQMGFEAPVFIAGFSGAFVFVTKVKNATKAQQFIMLVSGGLSANYLTPLVGGWLHLDSSVLYGIAFLLGFSGMKSVELLTNKLFKKLDNDANSNQRTTD